MSGEGGGVGWGGEGVSGEGGGDGCGGEEVSGGGGGDGWGGDGMGRGGDGWSGDGQGWERRGVGMVGGEVMSHPHLTLTQEWGWVGIKGKKMVGGMLGRGWVWIGGERDGMREENRNERGVGMGWEGREGWGWGVGMGGGGEGRCEEGGYGEEMGGVQWRGEDMGEDGVAEVRR
ncbi:hypothetical protein V8E53_011714 [Lactarius tabidus]